MKKYLFLILLGMLSFTSCTIGPADTSKGDSITALNPLSPQSSENRYLIYKAGEKTITASGIVQYDTVITPVDGSPMEVQAVDFVCPCGRTGTTVMFDSIVKIK